MRIPTERNSACSRSRVQTSKPSILGIWRSSTITSGCPQRRVDGSRPSLASVTAWPSAVRRAATRRRTTTESSTTRTFIPVLSGTWLPRHEGGYWRRSAMPPALATPPAVSASAVGAELSRASLPCSGRQPRRRRRRTRRRARPRRPESVPADARERQQPERRHGQPLADGEHRGAGERRPPGWRRREATSSPAAASGAASASVRRPPSRSGILCAQRADADDAGGEHRNDQRGAGARRRRRRGNAT